MHPRTRTIVRVRHGLLAMATLLIVASLPTGAWAEASAEPATPNLKNLFEGAWAREPEAISLQARG